ncbi:metallophosphoesterase family protein [Paenibacillus sp. GCM10012303]|uniref:metallophosphoesterase family protein n=1 Tax=Paenibacillus sp. GCM10012303 TaxID=3317340 RepID=UPI00360B17FB
MAEKKKLQFRADGTFKIVQIADLHYEGGVPEDLRTIAAVQSVLEAERPDFVVFTGDAVKGNRCPDQLGQFLELLALPESYGIPYAFTFGNHDSEHDMCTREEMMEAASRRPLCYAEAGPDDVTGVGNYMVTVASAADGEEPKAAFYFFDTGCSAPKHIIKSYAWLERNQVDWYIRQSEALTQRSGEPLPALAFFHIPLPEYNDVWDFHTCYGVKNENVGCPRLNTGMFAAMKQMGDVMGTFVGHDHTNDYWGDLYGIRLCYGRASGYNTVGGEEFARGSRVIRLREGERGFETWIRMADGSVVDEQPEHTAIGRVPPVPRVKAEPAEPVEPVQSEQPVQAAQS